MFSFSMRGVLPVLFALICLAMPVATAWADGPPQSQIYQGAEIVGSLYREGNPPYDMRSVASFESHAGKGASILTFGDAWQRGGKYLPFPTAGFETFRRHGSITMYTWTSAGDNWSDFSNAQIISGRHDAYIHAWAHAAAVWGHPFFLRFDHEMNGDWYPWSVGHHPDGSTINNNAPGSYVAMWRHVWKIFQDEGATNATWVWAANYECYCPGKYVPLSQVYPGDAYVDWTGLDPYNRSECDGCWTKFAQMFLGGGSDHLVDTYHKVLAVAPSKPMMIPEYGSIEGWSDPQAKPVWLRDGLLKQLREVFPAIKAAIYFNEDINEKSIPIESSALSQAAYANALSSAQFATNTFANLPEGKIKPLTEQVVYLTATADTYVGSDAPATTHGGTTQLYVGGSAAAQRKSYVRFDLGSLAGKRVSQASLRFTTTATSDAASQGSLVVRYDANTTWNQSNMTWISQGGPWDVGGVLGTLLAPSQRNTTYEVRLAVDEVQNHAGGLLSMQLSGGADNLVIDSREASNADSRPQLEVAYH